MRQWVIEDGGERGFLARDLLGIHERGELSDRGEAFFAFGRIILKVKHDKELQLSWRARWEIN